MTYLAIFGLISFGAVIGVLIGGLCRAAKLRDIEDEEFNAAIRRYVTDQEMKDGWY
jgi:hypothetical protein